MIKILERWGSVIGYGIGLVVYSGIHQFIRNEPAPMENLILFAMWSILTELCFIRNKLESN